MKKTRFLTLLWVVLISGTLAGCLNNSNNESDWTWDFIIEDITWETDAVVNYNDTLVDLAFNCIMSEDNVRNVYDNESTETEDMQKAIDNTIDECTKAWDGINKLWDREWDSSLKDWVLYIIEKEIEYYTKFSELLPYLQKDELTDEESETYNNLFTEVETLDSELSQANENLISIQEEFAKNHWFELEWEENTGDVVEEVTE